MDQVFPPTIVILGPTASGKTRLACRLAATCAAGILSADSRQVYRGLTIGTGKDLHEFWVDGQAIPYYLIDHVQPGESYDVAQFQQDALAVLTDFPHPVAIICGGTGLYLQAILQGFDRFQYPVFPDLRERLESRSYEALLGEWEQLPSLAIAIDVSTKKRLIRGFEIRESLTNGFIPKTRPKLQPVVFGLNPSRDVRRERISIRLKKRLQEGLLEEVQGLLDQGVSEDWLDRLGLEYTWAMKRLRGQISDTEWVIGLETAIHQMAKRQMTFFRSMERKGIEIHWLDDNLEEEALLSEIKKKIPLHIIS